MLHRGCISRGQLSRNSEAARGGRGAPDGAARASARAGARARRHPAAGECAAGRGANRASRGRQEASGAVDRRRGWDAVGGARGGRTRSWWMGFKTLGAAAAFPARSGAGNARSRRSALGAARAGVYHAGGRAEHRGRDRCPDEAERYARRARSLPCRMHDAGRCSPCRRPTRRSFSAQDAARRPSRAGRAGGRCIRQRGCDHRRRLVARVRPGPGAW